MNRTKVFQSPDWRHTTRRVEKNVTTMPFYLANSTLLPAGLLGNVSISLIK